VAIETELNSAITREYNDKRLGENWGPYQRPTLSHGGRIKNSPLLNEKISVFTVAGTTGTEMFTALIGAVKLSRRK